MTTARPARPIEWLSSRRAPVLTSAAALVSTAIFVAVFFAREHIDLEVYRFAVLEWWRGGDFYGPLPATEAGIQLPFIYPPFAVVAAIPFTAVPWTLSVTFLFALNLACLCGTLYVVGRRVWPSAGTRGALLVATGGLPLALALEPTRETFGFGQVNILLMGLVAIDCLAPNARWPRGIGIGLAAAIKLTPAAFVLYFLLRKDFRAVVVAGVTGIVATGIGFLAAPEASMRYWGGEFAKASGLSESPFRTNQSFAAVFARFGIEKPLQTVVVAVCVLALLVAVVYVVRRSAPATGLMTVAVLALLASPISWSHHWVWATPALIVLAAHAARAWRDGAPRAGALLACVAFTALLFIAGPFHWMPGHDEVELQWSVWQHIVGNAYVLAGLAWTIGYALYLRANRSAPQVHDSQVISASA